MGKLKHKIPAGIGAPDNFFVINKVFYKKSDYLWVEGITRTCGSSFWDTEHTDQSYWTQTDQTALQQSLQVLSYRNNGTWDRKGHTVRQFWRYFLSLSRTKPAGEWIPGGCCQMVYLGKTHFITRKYKRGFAQLQPEYTMDDDQRKEYGTSLAQTFIIKGCSNRSTGCSLSWMCWMGIMCFNTRRFTEYFKTVVRNENKRILSRNLSGRKYRLPGLPDRRTWRRTGERYITTTRREFWKMFQSAPVWCHHFIHRYIIKNLLEQHEAGPFWQGFLYSSITRWVLF